MEAIIDLFGDMTVHKSTKRKRVAQTVIYARMSSDAQSSISDQIEACQQYAKRFKLPPSVSIFTDVGSGMNIKKLKAHQLMVNQLVSNAKSHLVIYDMSRLGRCTEVMQLVEHVVNFGIKIHSIQDNLIVESEMPYSRLRAHALICASIEFSKALSSKIKSSLALKKQRGVFTGRKVPYGFKISTHESNGVSERYLVIDPETFPDAKRLAKTTRKTVNRPRDMTPAGLKRHRLKFRSYVKLARANSKKLV